MQPLKKILTALLLISILPWCSLAAASAATSDSDREGNAYFSDDAARAQRADPVETNLTAPRKSKPIAVLQQYQCGANAPLLSEADHSLFSSGTVHWVLENPNFTPHGAQAPPTSPPRSV